MIISVGLLQNTLDLSGLNGYKEKKLRLYDTSALVNSGDEFINNLTANESVPVIPDFIYRQLRKVTFKKTENIRRIILTFLRHRGLENFIFLKTPFDDETFNVNDYVESKRVKMIITSAATRNEREVYEDGSFKRKVDYKDAMLLTLFYILRVNGFNAVIVSNDMKVIKGKDNIEALLENINNQQISF